MNLITCFFFFWTSSIDENHYPWTKYSYQSVTDLILWLVSGEGDWFPSLSSYKSRHRLIFTHILGGPCVSPLHLSSEQK